MAVAAEQAPKLYEPLSIIPLGYGPVDQSPLLAAVRREARLEAYTIINERRLQQEESGYNVAAPPVDALGSARAVVAARNTLGVSSPEAHELYLGLQLDCQRLLAEAARKNTYEYFPPLKQRFDKTTAQYYSHDFSIWKMTESALNPDIEPEEQERRVNERVEEATYRAIGQLAISAPEKNATPRRIRTISECPDWAIEAYKLNPSDGHYGYVPAINKLMIRDVIFDPVSGDRTEEQVGLPGQLIDQTVIRQVLQARGVPNAANLSKTQLQAMQFEATDELLDFVAMLDAAASSRHETNVFMGEPATANAPAGYKNIPPAAQQRQSLLTSEAVELANSLIALEEQGTDHEVAARLTEALVKDILLKLADVDSTVAATAFDAKTAQGYGEVKVLFALGAYKEAQDRLEQVKANAPAPSFCGAGSCGLERAEVTGDKAKTMKEMGLDSASSLKDTERRCPKCYKKEIVYDLKQKVKACLSCKSTTSFGSK